MLSMDPGVRRDDGVLGLMKESAPIRHSDT
jgi:hypothetical protein